MAPEEVSISRKVPCINVKSNPCNNIHSCVIPKLKPSSSHFKIQVGLKGRNHSTTVAAIVDCSATALFISEKFVKRHRIHTCFLNWEIPLYNIDGSKNRVGKISCFAHLWLQVGSPEEWHDFLIMDLGPEDVVLGLPWLRSTNPTIDWAEGTMKVDSEAGMNDTVKVEWVAANRVQCQWWWRSRVLEDPSATLSPWRKRCCSCQESLCVN